MTVVAGADLHLVEHPGLLEVRPRPLPVSEVHCWSAALDVSPGTYKCLRATLSGDELERSARFTFEQDRLRFIVARGILRDILGRYLDEDPGELGFDYGPSGKPELWSCFDSGLRFNLSHADGRALIAVAADARVGIDLERLRPRADHADVAREYFPARESAALSAIPRERYAEAFLGCWTKREAYLKACGDGLTLPMSSVPVPMITDASLEPIELCMASYDLDPTGHWSFYTLRPARGYIGALVLEGAGRRLQHWRWQVARA